MARVCQVTGKKWMSGNTVSHANNKRKRRFLPNIQSKRIWMEEENRFVRIRLAAAGLRTLEKMLGRMSTREALQQLGLI